SATFHGGDSWDSTGLDFSDYARCGRATHKLSGARRLDTPEWALVPSKLRAVIVRVMELRALFVAPQPGTDGERLARAQARIADRLPGKEEALTKTCQQFVAMKSDPAASPERIKKLSECIESLDSEILTLRQPDHGASQLVGIVNYYYSV